MLRPSIVLSIYCRDIPFISSCGLKMLMKYYIIFMPCARVASAIFLQRPNYSPSRGSEAAQAGNSTPMVGKGRSTTVPLCFACKIGSVMRLKWDSIIKNFRSCRGQKLALSGSSLNARGFYKSKSRTRFEKSQTIKKKKSESSPISEIEWWPRPGSNRRHTDFQSVALPTELPSPVRENGRSAGIRTLDPVIKSHLLYQLSYAPISLLW